MLDECKLFSFLCTVSCINWSKFVYKKNLAKNLFGTSKDRRYILGVYCLLTVKGELGGIGVCLYLPNRVDLCRFSVWTNSLHPFLNFFYLSLLFTFQWPETRIWGYTFLPCFGWQKRTHVLRMGSVVALLCDSDQQIVARVLWLR